MDDLYRDIILDHYQHPRNKGSIQRATDVQKIVIQKAINAGCGDAIEVQFLVENGKVIQVGWSGEGCAISQAAVSIWSEWVIGKQISEVMKTTRQQILTLMGFESLSPAREKCALMVLQITQGISTLVSSRSEE